MDESQFFSSNILGYLVLFVGFLTIMVPLSTNFDLTVTVISILLGISVIFILYVLYLSQFNQPLDSYKFNLSHTSVFVLILALFIGLFIVIILGFDLQIVIISIGVVLVALFALIGLTQINP